MFVSDHGAGEGVRPRVLRRLRRRDASRDDAPPGRGATSSSRAPTIAPASAERRRAARPAAPSPAPGDGRVRAERRRCRWCPVLASDEERLRDKHFDALEPGELAALYRLMTELEVAAPIRRTRRAQARPPRRAHRPAPHAARLAAHRRRSDQPRAASDRREVRRRIVLLCDISGSMEPYARAYLQFLTCAGRDAEAFVFATRLTRITRALATRSPERAIQRAAAAAPDWSIRDAHRRGAEGLQRPPRPPRDGARRGDRDPQRRLGARRPGARRAGDGAARAARVPDRVGEPARGRRRLRAAGRRDGGGAAAHRRARLRPHAGGDARGDRARSAPSARASSTRSKPEDEDWASATPVAGIERRHAQRLRPEPRKDDARMDSPLKTCIYPGCDRPVVPPPEAGGPPSAFCDREDHNALTAHQERKRLGGADGG